MQSCFTRHSSSFLFNKFLLRTVLKKIAQKKLFFGEGLKLVTSLMLTLHAFVNTYILFS